jgi:hypothetical protein
MYAFGRDFPDIASNARRKGWLTSIIQLGGWVGSLSSGFSQKSSHESIPYLVEHYGSCLDLFLPRALSHQHICSREDCLLALELVPCQPSGKSYRARVPVRLLMGTARPL